MKPYQTYVHRPPALSNSLPTFRVLCSTENTRYSLYNVLVGQLGQLSYQKNSRFKTSLTWKGTQSVWGRTRSGWGRTRSGWGRTRPGWGRTRSSSVEVGANSVGANSSWGETGRHRAITWTF